MKMDRDTWITTRSQSHKKDFGYHGTKVALAGMTVLFWTNCKVSKDKRRYKQ